MTLYLLMSVYDQVQYLSNNWAIGPDMRTIQVMNMLRKERKGRWLAVTSVKKRYEIKNMMR